jgi:hypothetical protein
MKLKNLALMVALMSVFLGSCATYSPDYLIIRDAGIPEKDYKIVGTVRIEAKVGKKGTSFDGLLQEARNKYGELVDVINIKKDELTRGKRGKVILNAYVIEYI